MQRPNRVLVLNDFFNESRSADAIPQRAVLYDSNAVLYPMGSCRATRTSRARSGWALPCRPSVLWPSPTPHSRSGLDLSEAASLVEVWGCAFCGTDLESTLVIPTKLTRRSASPPSTAPSSRASTSRRRPRSWRSVVVSPSMTLALRARL